MKKKFKCREVHYIDKCFLIEYCNYYFIPVWKTLETYHKYALNKIPELFSKEQTEYFIENASSISFIENYKHEKFLDSFCESFNQNSQPSFNSR